MIKLIACVGQKYELGLQGNMPWGMNMRNDLVHFKNVTMGYPVLMGSKTFFSIAKPLPNRTNIVLTKNVNETKKKINRDDVIVIEKIDDIIHAYEKSKQDLFVIGGAEIYQLFLPFAHQIYFF